MSYLRFFFVLASGGVEFVNSSAVAGSCVETVSSVVKWDLLGVLEDWRLFNCFAGWQFLGVLPGL